MQAATILPQPYLNLIKDETYHLALAHLIDKEGFEQYSVFYHQIGMAPNKFLIMDNGLIEGDPRPIEELVQKASLIGADELVLPDVFQDTYHTLKVADAALEYMDANRVELRTMIVPQGNSYEQWLDCAKKMIGWNVSTISIPKIVTKMAGRDGRLKALVDLQELLHEFEVDVHLLGCWDSPLELKVIENAVRAGEIRPVRGVDSAIAYVYARSGFKMSEAPRPEGKIDFAAKDAVESALIYNIGMWKYECAALPSLDSRKDHRLF